MRYALLFILLSLLPVAADQSKVVLTFHDCKAEMDLPPLPVLKVSLNDVKTRTLTGFVGPGPAVQQAVAIRQVQIQQAGQVVMAGGRPVFIRVGAPQSDQSVPASKSNGPPVLRWKNGESVPGEIAAASAATITWKTPLFEDPLEIEWSAIDRVDCPQGPGDTTEPFSFALRDGSFIYGDLVSVGDDSIAIHSDRHGNTTLKRSEVLSARRLKSKDILFSGPTGDESWQPMRNQQDGNIGQDENGGDVSSPLATGPDGALLVRYWNRSAKLDLDWPNSVEVEFSVHSSDRPGFSLWLGGNMRDSLRIETWYNEVVVVARDQFQVIHKFEESERSISLRVCWDQKTHRCSIYTPAGELITEWTVPNDLPPSGPGLVIQNKGLDLSLDSLQVRAWNGKSPAKYDAKQPRVDLADGRTIGGAIKAGAPGSILLQAPGQSAPASISLHDVDSLVFSSDAPKISDNPGAMLEYADGAMVFGSLNSIGGGHVSLSTSFTAQPFVSQMKMLRELVVGDATAKATAIAPLASLDKIVVQDTTLHGKVESAGTPWPVWTPVGGVKPSRPSKTVSSEITRSFPGDPPAPTDPALFYLASGDVLPGSLKSLDRTGAEFESSIMAARKFPAAELEAIQFPPSARAAVKGFDDPSWQIIKGTDKTVRRHDAILEMDAGTTFGNASLMQSSEISFKYASTGYSACRLRLFCDISDSSKSIDLLLGNTGGQFIAGIESSPGQFDNQWQVRTQPGQPVALRMEIGESKVELFVNDVSLAQFPINAADCGGSGLVFEPAGMWGNGIFPVQLSGLSAKTAPGRTWLPEVNSDIKTQVLTVPRFEKDDPPRHFLLAANGDVLRGEIDAATDTHFGFRCGMENLNVPRDRVKAVIWPKQPAKDSSGTAATAAVPADKPATDLLDQRLNARMMFNGASLNQLLSFIQSQAQDFKFQPPAQEPSRRIQMLFASQTVGEALAIICSRFDLQYRKDADGTIVFEAASPAPKTDGMDRKSYWLKPDAFAKDASVQNILTGKGIAFPDGSSVAWQPATNTLSMTNTADNQTKLEALITSDYGGSLGSPTHWLLLVSGARLALAVDKFDKDFVTGHNPAYGSCKVPMSQVCVIRTSPPEPSVASKSLENWQLVNAPEPVLPVSGGETSPLLGKDAPTFKLAMLDGSDFDLSAEKGHVVVLDFWASWCGPCVKSLPGLIDTVASFPSDRVKLIGLNQGESPDQVKHFLEARGLKLTVAMDVAQGVGQKYGVDAIPHTIIVGPDGKIALVQTGYNPDGDTEASDTIKRLLEPASASNPPQPGSPQ